MPTLWEVADVEIQESTVFNWMPFEPEGLTFWFSEIDLTNQEKDHQDKQQFQDSLFLAGAAESHKHMSAAAQCDSVQFYS